MIYNPILRKNIKMNITRSQAERNNILNSVQNQIKQKVNPYFLSEIEKAVKISLNPLSSEEEVQ